MTRDSSSVVEQNRLLSQLLSLSSGSSTLPRSTEALVEVSDRVPAGRGLVFTAQIQPEQVLLTLPLHSLINVKTYKTFFHPDTLPTRVRVASTDNGNSVDRSDHRLSSAQLLSLLLTRARVELNSGRKRTKSDQTSKHEALQLFVQTLPQRFGTVPLTWSMLARSKSKSWKQSFFETLLQALPPHSRDLNKKVRQRFETDWDRISTLRASERDLLAEPALLLSDPDLAGSTIDLIDVDTFLWAWLCVNSRCLFLPLGLADHADNFTLAPLLDMANHTSDPALECKVVHAPDGGFRLLAPSKEVAQKVRSGDDCHVAKAGDECFITYGPHSNETLLSEYGFVLPAQLTFAEDVGTEAATSELNVCWRGSRYVDVLMDQHVERLLRAQGADGETKIELLQNRGYWGEFTIHPYPEPAHPSHRLIPALRLAAVDLQPPFSAAQQSKVARTKTKPGVKAGKKATFTPHDAYGGGDESSDFNKWEATLTGFREYVSEDNERKARQILMDLCNDRAKDNAAALRHLEAAQSMLAEHNDDLDLATEGIGCEPDFEACKLSMAFVQQLLDEEQSVLELVRQAAEDQVEW
ncbi:potential protein lysine methyltransferase [Pseudozyma hubeiensis SY62]|uniref:Potential protein lysine methyltransferase n=1 Tax=Pseudozyma hubeiensis (strain SY62) TaxID=1305764 RepID=R9P0B2_PSEHS|nr:potential protein lysine methyltransferase [Pseudozyma hubeiensis SY62]GAC94524.1 potential protein lysine methyltransferase [Pseudozyma hubeiensis SY62]